jgi:hypothetical protein
MNISVRMPLLNEASVQEWFGRCVVRVVISISGPYLCLT